MEDSVPIKQRLMEADQLSSSFPDQNPGKKNLEEGDDHVVLDIEAPGGACSAAKMLEKLAFAASLSLLQASAGSSSCSIYRIPFSLKEINRKAYDPQIVSIGPYHHGKHHLKMMEKHKFESLRLLLGMAKGMDIKMMEEPHLKMIEEHKSTVSENLFDAGMRAYLYASHVIGSQQSRIRESYSEAIRLDYIQLTDMMIGDGVFILDCLLKSAGLVPIEKGDPIFDAPGVVDALSKDLLLLDNQIPFFVLETLFEQLGKFEAVASSSSSLSALVLRFFNLPPSGGPCGGFKPKHLLDLLRWTMIPGQEESGGGWRSGVGLRPPRKIRAIPSSTELRKEGVTIRPAASSGFLELMRFAGGVLEMPAIIIDDYTVCFLSNCVAFEQCYGGCSRHFTHYATLMRRLAPTAADFKLLSELKIVQNNAGSDAEMVELFNKLGSGEAVDYGNSSIAIAKLSEDLSEYCERKRRNRAGLLGHAFLCNPWPLLADCTAFLLLLVAIQTFKAAGERKFTLK